MTPAPNPVPSRAQPPVPDAAITTGARAVAAFADQHKLDIPADLREDLARDVLTAARPHLTSTSAAGAGDVGE